MSSKSERAGLRLTATILMALIGLTAFSFGAEKKKPRSPWAFRISAEGEIKYDDNIIGLSEAEKDALNDPATGNSDRFRIETADDVIVSPKMSLSFDRSPRGGRDTDITLSLRAYEYTRNSVKSYEQVAFSFRQELTRSDTHRTALIVGGSRIPSYYLRELIDDDESQAAGTTIRNSADYALNRGFIEISQEVIDRTLSVRGGYARERRDFNDHFDERDSGSDIAILEANVFPTKSFGFRLQPYYEHEKRVSRGDIGGTVVVDDDVGFDGDLFGLQSRWLWGETRDRRSVVSGFYEMEKRDFSTSDNQNTSHFGREDDIRKFGAGYEKELGATWSVEVSAYHRTNDVSLPTRGTTTFTKNVVTASVRYGFERRLGGARRAKREQTGERE